VSLRVSNVRQGMKILKKIFKMGGKTYITSELFKVKKVITYTKNIPLGWFDYPYRSETYNINLNATKRILILGGTGSGKSWLARAIMNRAYMAGINPVIATDISPEYYTSQYPLPEEFKKFILDIEKDVSDKGLPMKIYYPYFLYKFMGYNLPNQIIYQYSIKNILPTDLVAFIDYNKLSFMAKREVEDLIASMSRSKERFNSVDSLISYISSKDLNIVTKRILIESFRNLKNLGIFGEDYPSEDVVGDINNNIIPDFNLFGWQRLEFKNYVAIYLSLMLRKLLSAKELGQIKQNKHILLLFEELHQFAPKRANNPAQEIIRSAIRDIALMGRKAGISAIFITQSPETIDPTIMEQCDIILIPRGFEVYKLMEIVKNYLPDYYTSRFDFREEITEYMRSLRKWPDGARDWLVLEKEKGEESGRIIRITPLGPLTAHKLELGGV